MNLAYITQFCAHRIEPKIIIGKVLISSQTLQNVVDSREQRAEGRRALARSEQWKEHLEGKKTGKEGHHDCPQHPDNLPPGKGHFYSLQYSSEHSYSAQYNSVQYSSVQQSIVQHSTVQHSTVQHSAVKYSTVQFSAVEHSKVQLSTVQHIIAQYKTVYYSSAGKC